MTFTPATFIVAFLFGALSAYLAHRQGRNPYRWFFIGSLCGIVGLFAILFLSRSKAPAPLKDTPLPVIEGPSDKFWYYLDATQQQQGPMSHHAITSALRQGKISLSTYVWNEDMCDWKILQEFVKGDLKQSPPLTKKP